MKRPGRGWRGNGWNRLQRLNRMRRKPFRCHSERSEEPLLIQNKSLRGILRAIPALRMTAFRLFPQPLKPPVMEMRVGRAEARPSEGLLPRTGREEQASNSSNWVSHVPPLRGLVRDTNSVPPLPRWAKLFRPCRDWPSEGCPPTDQFSEGGPSR
jgi:hypothetical protein